MADMKTCIIIGASHGGVNCAFALRKEGWEGRILLFDRDPNLPYHRPPLSKGYILEEDSSSLKVIKSRESYENNRIDLRLGVKAIGIDRRESIISFDDGSKECFTYLILAIGATALVPPIPGLKQSSKIFTLRNANDAYKIKSCFESLKSKRVLVVGGGFIGLEIAASLNKKGATVSIVERENRLLSRVSADYLSQFFEGLHGSKGIQILKNLTVMKIEDSDGESLVYCSDSAVLKADMVVLGVGVKVNVDLANDCGLTIKDGIEVDQYCRTNDPEIYAIGDCAFHYNDRYDYYLRLESVQNAVDQAKVAAANICGREKKYQSIPWFWSDQYDIKLQIVGLSKGYDKVHIRREDGKEQCFSLWYFKDNQLIAVDAINNARAYMLGTKFLQSKVGIDIEKLLDPKIPLKPNLFEIKQNQ